jgi:hypothetical protein
VTYLVGDVVSYPSPSRTYRCRQAHVSYAGAEPPNAPSLWELIPCPTPTPPSTPAPSGLSAVAGDQRITLYWRSTSTSGDGTFNVRRSDVAGGPYATIATVTLPNAMPTYTDLGLQNGKRYYYVVNRVYFWTFGGPPCPVQSGSLGSSNSNETSAVAGSTPVSPTPAASATVTSTSLLVGNTVYGLLRATSNLGLPQYTLAVKDAATGQDQNPSLPIVSVPSQSPPGQWSVTALRTGSVRFVVTVSGQIYNTGCSCWQAATTTATSPVVTISQSP